MILLWKILGAYALLTCVLLLYPLLKRGRILSALLIALIIIGGSIGLYSYVGAPLLIDRMNLIHTTIKERLIAVKANPNDLESWVTLGQAYSDNGNYAAAAEAFKQSVLLSKGDATLITAYAEALILQANGKVTPQAQKSLNIALMINPEQPLARYYQAISLLQQNKPEEAMPMMKKLYNELPETSALKQRMKAQIGR